MNSDMAYFVDLFARPFNTSAIKMFTKVVLESPLLEHQNSNKLRHLFKWNMYVQVADIMR